MIHPQLLAGALQMAAHMAQCRHERDRELAMAELKNSALAQMLDAIVHKRISAVQSGFDQLLGHFAEQARHLMAQQSEYARAEIAAPDARRRIELASRVRDIDGQLLLIRADARLIYDRMTEVVLAIAGPDHRFASEHGLLLQLHATPA